MTRAVFFDVDGVLNTTSMWTRPFVFDPARAKLLSAFVRKRKATPVMTSSWRRGNADAVAPYFPGMDATPVLPGRRRTAEIERYLYTHPDVGEYLVIDDDRSEFEKPIRGLFLCDPEEGITRAFLRATRFVPVER